MRRTLSLLLLASALPLVQAAPPRHGTSLRVDPRVAKEAVVQSALAAEAKAKADVERLRTELKAAEQAHREAAEQARVALRQAQEALRQRDRAKEAQTKAAQASQGAKEAAAATRKAARIGGAPKAAPKTESVKPEPEKTEAVKTA